ncbi:nuclease C1, partial [Vibrio parahaemolyticus VPTS-2010_2]
TELFDEQHVASTAGV